MNGYKNDYKLETKFKQFSNMKELLLESKRRYPNNIAFVTKVKDRETKQVAYVETTYTKLYNDMVNLGDNLLARGLENENIALIGDNSYHWVLSYFTISSGIGCIVPLDKLLQKEEIASCLRRSKSSVVFTDKKHLPIIEEIYNENRTPIKRVIGLDFSLLSNVDTPISCIESIYDLTKANVTNRRFEAKVIDNDKTSFLLFTSGTTNQSKAVMLSQKNLMSCNYAMNCEELFFEDDVNLMILPLHHCYGMSGLITFLSQGMKTAFCDGLKYIPANLKEYKATVIMSVPLLLENIYKKINLAIDKKNMRNKVNKALKLANFLDKIGIHIRRKLFKGIIDELGGNLRFIINGAAALDKDISKGFNDFGILTVQGYGLTEAAPTIASESYRYLKAGSVGKVMPNIEYKLIDKNEEGIGELIVKGDNIMLGYLDDDENTSQVLKDGWLYTGDLAYVDEEGYLFITGRAKNVIVLKNGKNVYPEELESLILALEYIDEALVITQKAGNDVVLLVKVVYQPSYCKANNLSVQELEAKFKEDLDKINDTLPSYKRIKRILFSDVPMIKTTTQKVKRKEEINAIKKELENINKNVDC